jgi:type I restriction enzyme S subunit
LDASNKGEVIVKSLDELGTFTRGRRFVRTDIVPEGVPCIHYGDMYTYYGVSAEETPTHLTKELSSKLRFAKTGDVVIVAAGENDLDIGVGVAWLGKEPVVVHDACFIYEHKMVPKYVSHFMRSRNYHQQIRMGVVDGKICSISAKELGRALIAVPSLQEQQRIVSILDTFEAAIQNLEAQLEQREKQYEYYRNKLLTFE